MSDNYASVVLLKWKTGEIEHEELVWKPDPKSSLHMDLTQIQEIPIDTMTQLLDSSDLAIAKSPNPDGPVEDLVVGMTVESITPPDSVMYQDEDGLFFVLKENIIEEISPGTN